MESEEVRYKGIRKDSGKILKGTVQEAPLKLKASSIPSKIENLVYSNHHTPAFGNSQQRFYTPTSLKSQQSPGPGNYAPLPGSSRIDSKRGFGNFASLTKLTRFNQKRNWNPGPGQYDFSLARSKRAKSTQHFNSTVRNREIFKDEIKVATTIPGPGEYQEKLKRAASTYTAIFKSNLNRFQMTPQKGPPVGNYKWDEIKKKVLAYKFKGLDKKDESRSIPYQQMQNMIGKKTESAQKIGPGTYQWKNTQNSKGFKIKDGNIDRFGIPKDRHSNQQAGPEKMFHSPIKQGLISERKANPHSSIFQSKSRRYEFGQQQKQRIGDPSRYSPEKSNKKSHIINFGQKWI